MRDNLGIDLGEKCDVAPLVTTTEGLDTSELRGDSGVGVVGGETDGSLLARVILAPVGHQYTSTLMNEQTFTLLLLLEEHHHLQEAYLIITRDLLHNGSCFLQRVGKAQTAKQLLHLGSVDHTVAVIVSESKLRLQQLNFVISEHSKCSPGQ